MLLFADQWRVMTWRYDIKSDVSTRQHLKLENTATYLQSCFQI